MLNLTCQPCGVTQGAILEPPAMLSGMAITARINYWIIVTLVIILILE